MLDCRFKAFYYEELVTKYQLFNRRINVFLAITSSGSIASWAIWNDLSFIWAIIIASSTVINVIKPHFPFHKYIKDIDKVVTQLEIIYLDFEVLWYKYENNKINKNESFEELIKLKKRIVEVLKFSDDTILKEDPKIESLANKSMDAFLKNNYNIDR